jgi:hypothetical protein
MNDVVVRRIFAAGLDLQAGLEPIGDHRGASKTYHALDELDQAIRDTRDTIFDRSPPDSPCLSYEGARRTALYTNPRESGANEFPAPRAAVTHGGGRRVLLSCQRNWTRVTVSRKNPPLPACSVAQNHPTVMRAGTVIPPKIPSSSSSESQFSQMLAPGLAVGLSTGQADCPAGGRLRRRARRTLLGRPPRGRCPTAAAPRAAAALGDSGLPGAN